MLNKKIWIILAIVLFSGMLYVFLPGFSVKELEIIYPLDETVFPPDIASPIFRWDDHNSDAQNWFVHIK